QDSWETYEDSEDYYESFEEFDLKEATEYVCTELKDELKECVTRFFDPEKFKSFPAIKYRDCKNEINEVLLASTKGGSSPSNYADIYIEYCLNIREKLADEGWLEHFTKGIVVF
ncbi:hypothetical protein TNCT_713601, partial [Trichonephila clavata]